MRARTEEISLVTRRARTRAPSRAQNTERRATSHHCNTAMRAGSCAAHFINIFRSRRAARHAMPVASSIYITPTEKRARAAEHDYAITYHRQGVVSSSSTLNTLYHIYTAFGAPSNRHDIFLRNIIIYNSIASMNRARQDLYIGIEYQYYIYHYHHHFHF